MKIFWIDSVTRLATVRRWIRLDARGDLGSTLAPAEPWPGRTGARPGQTDYAASGSAARSRGAGREKLRVPSSIAPWRIVRTSST
jgi:hypothetical protein